MGLFTTRLLRLNLLPRDCPCAGTQPDGPFLPCCALSSHRDFICVVSSAWSRNPPSSTRPSQTRLILKGGHRFQSLPFLSSRTKSPLLLVAQTLHTGEVLRQDNRGLGLDGRPTFRSHDSDKLPLLPEPHFALSEQWEQEPSFVLYPLMSYNWRAGAALQYECFPEKKNNLC